LFDGKGVKLDHFEAVELFKRAAERHYPHGEVNFGYCLHAGCSIRRDHLVSVEYFKRAADQNHPIGQFNYGVCCYKGDGVPVNLAEAC
jgi:TPR repeat protein